MILEELITLENIICINSKVNLKATYTIINMKLTKLFDEVITELEKGFLPILEMQILFYTLKNVVFSNEIEGNRILSELCKFQNHQLCASDRRWSCNTILSLLKVLHDLITHDIRLLLELKSFLCVKSRFILDYDKTLISIIILIKKQYKNSFKIKTIRREK